MADPDNDRMTQADLMKGRTPYEDPIDKMLRVTKKMPAKIELLMMHPVGKFYCNNWKTEDPRVPGGKYTEKNAAICNRLIEAEFKWDDILGKRKIIEELLPSAFSGENQTQVYELPWIYLENPNKFIPVIIQNVFGTLVEGKWMSWFIVEPGQDSTLEWMIREFTINADEYTEGSYNGRANGTPTFNGGIHGGNSVFGFGAVRLPYGWQNGDKPTRFQAEFVTLAMIRAVAVREQEFYFKQLFRTIYGVGDAMDHTLGQPGNRKKFATIAEFLTEIHQARAVWNKLAETGYPLPELVMALRDRIRLFNQSFMADTEIDTGRAGNNPLFAVMLPEELLTKLLTKIQNFKNTDVGHKGDSEDYVYNREKMLIKSPLIVKDTFVFSTCGYHDRNAAKVHPLKSNIQVINKYMIPDPKDGIDGMKTTTSYLDHAFQIPDVEHKKMHTISFTTFAEKVVFTDGYGVIPNDTPFEKVVEKWVGKENVEQYFERLGRSRMSEKVRALIIDMQGNVARLAAAATDDAILVANHINSLYSALVSCKIFGESAPTLAEGKVFKARIASALLQLTDAVVDGTGPGAVYGAALAGQTFSTIFRNLKIPSLIGQTTMEVVVGVQPPKVPGRLKTFIENMVKHDLYIPFVGAMIADTLWNGDCAFMCKKGTFRIANGVEETRFAKNDQRSIFYMTRKKQLKITYGNVNDSFIEHGANIGDPVTNHGLDPTKFISEKEMLAYNWNTKGGMIAFWLPRKMMEAFNQQFVPLMGCFIEKWRKFIDTPEIAETRWLDPTTMEHIKTNILTKIATKFNTEELNYKAHFERSGGRFGVTDRFMWTGGMKVFVNGQWTVWRNQYQYMEHVIKMDFDSQKK